MSQQNINYGTTANDGTGDTLRNAAIKMNANFSETYQTGSLAFNQANSASSFANGAFTAANVSQTIDNTQNTNISSAQSYANSAYGQANSAASFANSAFAQANLAAKVFPQNAQTGSYVLTLSDAGKYIYYNGSQNTTVFIPTTANVAFSNGTLIQIVSQTFSNANVTINANSGVSLYSAGNTTASPTINVSSHNIVSLLHIKANTWFIQ
jgi:hypothetical protein